MRGSNHTSSGLSDVNGWKHESRVKLSPMLFSPECLTKALGPQTNPELNPGHMGLRFTLLIENCLREGFSERLIPQICGLESWSGVWIWGLVDQDTRFLGL